MRQIKNLTVLALRRSRLLRLFAIAVPLALGLAGSVAVPVAAESLQTKDAFSSISDEKARGVAIFQELGKVLKHPRCVNCHPVGNSPLQGEAMQPHQPPVQRGPANFGVAGMRCTTCHMPRNVDYAEMPGHPEWMLAPKSMAWEGKSLGEICVQIKDPERNGGKDMAALIEHMSKDTLVGWGWTPGKGREPAPGSQEAFGVLFEHWADTGAHCPPQ